MMWDDDIIDYPTFHDPGPADDCRVNARRILELARRLTRTDIALQSSSSIRNGTLAIPEAVF